MDYRIQHLVMVDTHLHIPLHHKSEGKLKISKKKKIFFDNILWGKKL